MLGGRGVKGGDFVEEVVEGSLAFFGELFRSAVCNDFSLVDDDGAGAGG